MYLLITNILIFRLCFAQGFGFFGHDTGYRYMMKEFSSMANIGRSSHIVMKWIKQPLDHSNKKDRRTWKMRYFENLEYFKHNGPIFLYIGGEDGADTAALTTGTMYELAKETNGAMIATEHRYYGESIPLPNNVTEHLKFLSSKQALADLAKLIKSLKCKKKKSKVVVVGGSYPGNLAAWAKQMYPKLIDAAISSGAPVLAKKNFYEYFEVVSNNYKQYGTPGCWEKISEIFQRYQRLLKANEGIKTFKREMNVCNATDMTLLENQEVFFDFIMGTYMFNSQIGTPKKIKKHCKNIIRNSGEIDTSLPTHNDHCNDFSFRNKIDSTKSNISEYYWMYQTCTEFGYYQTTDSKLHPFTQSISLNYYINKCTALFGPEFNEESIDEGIARTNARYHGLNPNVKHVVFVNSDMDAWGRLGVLEDLSNEAPAIVIHGIPHCRDLYSLDKPEQLGKARVYVKNLIKKWIKRK